MRYTPDQLGLLSAAARIALENGKITHKQYRIIEEQISQSIVNTKRSNINPEQINHVFQMAEEVIKKELHATHG